MPENVILYPTRSYIKKHYGGRDKLYPFMELNTMDIARWEAEFIIGPPEGACTYILGETVDGGSITGTVAGSSTIESGVCRLATSAETEKYVGVFPNGGESNMGAQYKGANSCVTWARIKLDSVDAVHVEVGFIDDDSDGGASNSLSGATTNSHDCAVWVYDTDDSGALYWQGVHSSNSQSASKVEPAVFLPVLATYEWLGVALNGKEVKFMHMDAAGTPDYESAWQSTGITATDSLSPWIFVQARSGTEILLDIDYWTAWQRRYATDD